MKLKPILFILFSFIATNLNSADYKTGDQQLDRWLVNIDHIAGQDWDIAVSTISEAFNANASYMNELVMNYEFRPGQLTLLLAVFDVKRGDWEEHVQRFTRFSPDAYEELMMIYQFDKNPEQLQQIKNLVKPLAPKGDPEADSRDRFKQ